LKLDRRAANALTNLRVNPAFGDLLTWLLEYEAKETRVCVEAEGNTLVRAQGAVRTLKRIREAYDEAPTTLHKLSITKVNTHG
jgi:hypothetical protein